MDRSLTALGLFQFHLEHAQRHMDLCSKRQPISTPAEELDMGWEFPLTFSWTAEKSGCYVISMSVPRALVEAFAEDSATSINTSHESYLWTQWMPF